MALLPTLASRFSAVVAMAGLPAALRHLIRVSCAHNGRRLQDAMRIIARRTLREFVASRDGHKDQPALKAALDSWFAEVNKAAWSSTADVKRLYATASIVSGDRIVFNIKGNAYRLVVAVDFEKAIVWIKWVGTHGDYDRIDVKEVKHGD
jgi:mRNA interferase HigB